MRPGLLRLATSLCSLLMILMLALVGSPAYAARTIVNKAVVEANLSVQGKLSVVERLSFDGNPAQFTQKILTQIEGDGGRDYLATLSNLSVTGGQVEIKKDSLSHSMVIKPEPGKEVVITYNIDQGAVRRVSDGTSKLVWNLWQGASLPVADFKGTVIIPQQLIDIKCDAGSPTATRACDTFAGGTTDAPMPIFAEKELGVGGIVQVQLQFDKGAVAANEIIRQKWSLDRAFSFSPVPLLVALTILILLGLFLWLLHKYARQDGAFKHPQSISSFVTNKTGDTDFVVKDGIRPGQIGVLLDEKVDPVDISATILDLARRGHLLITEVEPQGWQAGKDWTLQQISGKDQLLGYERKLLDALAPATGFTRVSEIGPQVHAVVGQIQQDLYQEMVDMGWYSRRPDQTRHSWSLIAWVSIGFAAIVLIILTIFTQFALTGLVLLVAAFALFTVAKEMPARTSKGAGVLAGLATMQQEIMNHDTATMGHRYQAISAVLPYAVVLGGLDRWLQALVEADDDPGVPDSQDLDWFHASTDWNLSDLPASLNTFLTTIIGKLYRRA